MTQPTRTRRRLAIYSTLRHHPWGAPDVLWVRAAEKALANGDAVFAVVRAQIMDHPRIHALRASGARICLVPDLAPGGHASQLARRWRNLRSGAHRTLDQLEVFAPDLVLINQGGFYDFILEDELRAYLVRSRRPYAVLAHSNWECEPLEADNRRIAVQFLTGAVRLFGISQYVLELAERQLLTRFTHTALFQNPLDLPSLDRVPWPQLESPSFAVVSRLDAHGKGLDLLLLALRDAPGLGEAWQLHVYGQGRDGEYLRALAAHEKLADRVTFHGHVADKHAIWSRSHLLLLPSRFEGCSYAMVEAMVCGRAVLRTNFGGVAEWMRDGENGFVCPAPERALLADTLARAWSRRREWRAMGEAAHAHAVSRVDRNPEDQLLALLPA